MATICFIQDLKTVLDIVCKFNLKGFKGSWLNVYVNNSFKKVKIQMFLGNDRRRR